MTDLQGHLNKLRSDAAECRLLSSLATDGKGEVFDKTTEHLNDLASEIEKTIATNSADKGARDESVLELRPAHEEAGGAERGGPQFVWGGGSRFLLCSPRGWA